MFREVTMIELKEVLRLWGKGLPKKRVAAQLGLDPKTVRRYLKVLDPTEPTYYFMPFSGFPRLQLQSLCSGFGAGGPATQGTELRYS